MDYLSKYSVEELQGYFSDFHKDFYGFRPRYATPEQWRDREWLEAAINAIHNTMDKMKESYSGREELRIAGWIIDETEFNDIIDPLEYAAWSDYLDAQAYGEMM
jgi:predicted deacylase